MSLVINVKEKNVFYAGHIKIFLKEIGRDSAVVSVPFMGVNEYRITSDMSVEILPEVYVFLHSIVKDKNGNTLAKLAIEAPKYVLVMKPHLYFKFKELKDDRKVW